LECAQSDFLSIRKSTFPHDLAEGIIDNIEVGLNGFRAVAAALVAVK